MAIASDLIISSDSHVMEPVDLWKKGVPEKYRDTAPLFPPHQVGEGFQQHAGGWDPNARMKEMEADGLSAEVLYPTLCLDLFALDDAGLQEACFRAYNDWLIDYCSVNTDRLIGIPAIPVYNIDIGIKELERCRKAGLKGCIIWQAPHPDLPFHSSHYDKFWSACEELDAPVSLHILTGHSYNKDKKKRRRALSRQRQSKAHGHRQWPVRDHPLRHTRKTSKAEDRFGGKRKRLDAVDRPAVGLLLQPLQEAESAADHAEPKQFVRDQVFACFFNDHVCGQNLEWWGQDNIMWSNDFPHPNSTWPNSLKIIQRDLGHLPAETQRKVVCDNVCRLYNVDASKFPRVQKQAA